MRKLLPYLTQGILACLGFGAFFFLWRRLSSVNSSDSSEVIESALEELKAWKRTVTTELEGQFDRVKSLAGRLDRAKRKENPSQEAQESPPETPPELDDQGKLNAILGRRFHGV